MITIFMNLNLKIFNEWNLEISGPTWDGKFELPDGSYSVFGIQDYFQYIIKKLMQWLIISQSEYM